MAMPQRGIANPMRLLRLPVRDRDDDLASRTPGLDVGQRISVFKREDLIHDWTDHAGSDQGRISLSCCPAHA